MKYYVPGIILSILCNLSQNDPYNNDIRYIVFQFNKNEQKVL